METFSDTKSSQIESLNLETEGTKQGEESFCRPARPGTGTQSLTSQVVFGSCVRPSASLDSLGTLYDSSWARQRQNNKKVKIRRFRRLRRFRR